MKIHLDNWFKFCSLISQISQDIIYVNNKSHDHLRVRDMGMTGTFENLKFGRWISVTQSLKTIIVLECEGGNLTKNNYRRKCNGPDHMVSPWVMIVLTINAQILRIKTTLKKGLYVKIREGRDATRGAKKTEKEAFDCRSKGYGQFSSPGNGRKYHVSGENSYIIYRIRKPKEKKRDSSRYKSIVCDYRNGKESCSPARFSARVFFKNNFNVLNKTFFKYIYIFHEKTNRTLI